MKKKNETFNKFKYFKQVAETKTNAKIGYLWINKGGEFILGTFNEVCEQHGIHRQLTQFHTYQNGLLKGKIGCWLKGPRIWLWKNGVLFISRQKL
jgi:hypothetical protein